MGLCLARGCEYGRSDAACLLAQIPLFFLTSDFSQLDTQMHGMSLGPRREVVTTPGGASHPGSVQSVDRWAVARVCFQNGHFRK